MLFDQRDHEVLVRVATQKAKKLTPCNSGGLEQPGNRQAEDMAQRGFREPEKELRPTRRQP